jgi:3-oxoacyl-[acyl-carrier-protein] synthase II
MSLAELGVQRRRRSLAGLRHLRTLRSILQAGLADVVLVGGSDAITNSLSIAASERLGGMTASLDPATAVRPFDAKRSGTALGDGAGILVLEAAAHAVARGVPVLANLAGVAMRRIGGSIRRTEPSDERDTLLQALCHARIPPGKVDVLFSHANGGPNADSREALAIKDVFSIDGHCIGGAGPLIAATHAALGHTGAATGALDAVLAVMAISRGRVPPIFNLTEPDPAAAGLRLAGRTAVNGNFRVVAVSAVGLGGGNAAAIFTAPQL